MSINILESWKVISRAYFSNEIYGEELLEKFILDVISSNIDFQRFFGSVIKGSFHQHYESHFFSMPENVLEDEREGYGKYQGNMKISWNNFDDQEHVGFVRLDKFCFYVKLAAVFHANYIDPEFDPWEGFQKMDKMERKYFPWPNEIPKRNGGC